MSASRTRPPTADDVVAISALTGEGVDALRRIVAGRLLADAEVHRIAVPIGDGAALAWLHEHGEVLTQQLDGETLALDVRLASAEWDRFRARR